MNAEYKKILKSLNERKYAPVYLIDGEENFYIDKLSEFFETNILSEAEQDFNLTILYGKDAHWSDVVNACKRFPMFAERQVVILKDAGQLKGGEGDMKGLNALLDYVEKPSPTTVFVVEHPFKKADAKTRFVKRVREKGIHFTSDKVKEERVPDWIESFGAEIGFLIGRQEAEVLASFLGNDLQKIANEIEKVRINVPNEERLSTDLIHKYIGVSKDYNVFEFPAALTGNDKDRFYRMLSYFLLNSKAAPLPLITGSFYNHFNKMYVAHSVQGKPDKEAAAVIGTAPYFVRGIMATLRDWPLARIERCLMLLAKYNTMAVGIHSTAGDREILKEMIGRMMEE